MSKIDEIKKRIVKNGKMSSEDLAEFRDALKRVRDNSLKRQHCYTMAVQFPPENAKQAVELINYGLQNFEVENDWYSTYVSYLDMGKIYEAANDHKNAYKAYLSAKEALAEEQASYLKELALRLLWEKLHIDNFKYSAELENYYNSYCRTDELSKAFVNNRFRMLIAGMVIELHYKRKSGAKEIYNEIIKMCDPDYKGTLYDLLKKHKFTEKLKPTPQVLEYLKKVKL